jgi:type II secretory pathway predicted ATPase ExeA
MYEAFYNLAAGPFHLTPDPRFLFPSDGHKRALAYLMYGLQRREGFVVITGDVGIGKTLLVQKLIHEIGGRSLSVVRVAMANLDADGVLPMVASAFGLAHEARSKVGLLNDLTAKILPNYNRGALLIVDEAQTCTPAALEELRAISNLQAHGRALLQVFLVGQSELRATLAHSSMEQLRQRVITSYHLRALDIDELRDYIHHRLAAAGWQSDPELAETIYPRVHAWSGGVPRRINMLMDRLLLYGYLEELHALDETDLQIVIEELDEELGDELVPAQSAPAPSATSPPALSDEQSDALLERLSGLEKAFSAAVGETRAKQLLDKHEASAQQQALIALNLRLDRLESLLSDRAALDALQDAQSSAEASTSKPAADAGTAAGGQQNDTQSGAADGEWRSGTEAGNLDEESAQAAGDSPDTQQSVESATAAAHDSPAHASVNNAGVSTLNGRRVRQPFAEDESDEGRATLESKPAQPDSRAEPESSTHDSHNNQAFDLGNLRPSHRPETPDEREDDFFNDTSLPELPSVDPPHRGLFGRKKRKKR